MGMHIHDATGTLSAELNGSNVNRTNPGMTHDPFTSWTIISVSNMSNRDKRWLTRPIPLIIPLSSRMSASTTSVPFSSPVQIFAFNKTWRREPSIRGVKAQDGHEGNHSWSSPRFKPIRHASGAEVGRRSGYGSQRATTVKRLDNVNRYLLLSTQELIVMKECERADARQ